MYTWFLYFENCLEDYFGIKWYIIYDRNGTAMLFEALEEQKMMFYTRVKRLI